MKKITLFLAVFVLVFSFNISQTGATTSTTVVETAGCESGAIYNYLTGEKCKNTDNACLPGYKFNPFTGVPCPVSGKVIISGVSGPTTLKVGEQGTWTVQASDQNNGTLSYSVIWGDETDAIVVASSGASAVAFQQTATFTHSYSQAGTYKPTFTVKNASGQSAEASLSVKVDETITASITVLSPNGGEIWKKDTTRLIQWQDISPIPLCVPDLPCAMPTYDIALQPYYPPCTSDPCPASAYPYQAPYIIAKGVSGSYYKWYVSSNKVIGGLYTVQVCRSGTETCDVSDSYFKINLPITTTYTTGTVQGAEYFAFTQKLYRGSVGNEVLELQKYLSNLGYSIGNIDGKFGLKTEAAVKQFQAAYGLKADGIVGAKVRKIINK